MEATEIMYRALTDSEIDIERFSAFNRKQIVTHCWRKENGQWVVKSVPFIDDWNEQEYRSLVQGLKNTLQTGGMVYGALVENKIKGFASVEAALFGSEKQYADLSNIHVSLEMRGKGVGTALFMAAKAYAKGLGAKKLYISAHSSVASQAFYQAMGCVEAMEYNRQHTEAEPCDCQLECALE